VLFEFAKLYIKPLSLNKEICIVIRLRLCGIYVCSSDPGGNIPHTQIPPVKKIVFRNKTYLTLEPDKQQRSPHSATCCLVGVGVVWRATIPDVISSSTLTWTRQ